MCVCRPAPCSVQHKVTLLFSSPPPFSSGWFSSGALWRRRSCHPLYAWRAGPAWRFVWLLEVWQCAPPPSLSPGHCIKTPVWEQHAPWESAIWTGETRVCIAKLPLQNWLQRTGGGGERNPLWSSFVNTPLQPYFSWFNLKSPQRTVTLMIGDYVQSILIRQKHPACSLCPQPISDNELTEGTRMEQRPSPIIYMSYNQSIEFTGVRSLKATSWVH